MTEAEYRKVIKEIFECRDWNERQRIMREALRKLLFGDLK